MRRTMHTRGSFCIDETDDTIFIGAPECNVAQIEKVQSGQPSDIHEQRANARLLAAAPDMLQVLFRIEAAWTRGQISLPVGCIDQIQAAIAKATK